MQVKKHVKAQAGSSGGIVTIPAPIDYSNVRLIDPETGRPCRTAYRYLEDGSKVRVSVGRGASGAVIPFPESLKERRSASAAGTTTSAFQWMKETYTILISVGEKDTTQDDVLQKTFRGFAASAVPSTDE